MEYSSDTSPLFKFAQAQLPVVVLMSGERWCRTLLSPSARQLDAGLRELRQRGAEAEKRV